MPQADKLYLAGEVAELSWAPKRVVLLWADAGALQALPDTERCGSGVHRQFPWREVEIAAVLHVIWHLSLPIGEMVRIAGELRAFLDDPAEQSWLQNARNGETGFRVTFGPPHDVPHHLELSLDLGLAWSSLFS